MDGRRRNTRKTDTFGKSNKTCNFLFDEFKLVLSFLKQTLP